MLSREDHLVAEAMKRMAAAPFGNDLRPLVEGYIRTAYSQGRAEGAGLLEPSSDSREGREVRSCETCGAKVIVHFHRVPIFCNRHTP